MLVLTRKVGETLIIDDNIKVTVVDIRGKQVRIGIEAPSHVSVNREEIFKALQKQNKKSAQTDHKLLTEITKKLDEIF